MLQFSHRARQEPHFLGVRMSVNVKLEGRSNEPLITITSNPGSTSRFHMELVGAELGSRVGSQSPDRWILKARHENGTDFEHDSATVAQLEGYALKFEYMQYGMAVFSTLLIAGYWYDSGTTFEPGMKFAHSSDHDKIEVCEDTDYYHAEDADWPAGHLLMPYMPPERAVEPVPVSITVDYNRFIPQAH